MSCSRFEYGKIMRASIIIVLLFAAGISVATNDDILNQQKSPEMQAIPPRVYQMAHGYGKRRSVVNAPMMNEHERILSTLLRYFPQGIPMEWLFQQMKTNPAFAVKLTQLLMDGTVDLTPIMDSSNSETTWLY